MLWCYPIMLIHRQHLMTVMLWWSENWTAATLRCSTPPLRRLRQWSLPAPLLAAEFVTCHIFTNGYIGRTKCHKWTGQFQVFENASCGCSFAFYRSFRLSGAAFFQWSFILGLAANGPSCATPLACRDCGCHWSIEGAYIQEGDKS